MKKVVSSIILLFLCTGLLACAKCAFSEQDRNTETVNANVAQQRAFEKYVEGQNKILEEDNRHKALVKEFEPTTGIGKFMGGFVSSFLIISIPIIILGWIFASVFDDDGVWGRVIKYYLVVALYLLCNYLVWIALKRIKFGNIDVAVSIMLVASAAIFMYMPISLHLENIKKRSENQIPTWLCSKCKVENHYNDSCWNCKTGKNR